MGYFEFVADNLKELAQNTYASISDFFNFDFEGFFGTILGVIKSIALIVLIIFGIGFVFVVINVWKLNRKRYGKIDFTPPETKNQGAIVARWQEVLYHMQSYKEAEWKFAIVEADKLTNDVLKRAGYEGESMGDRLTLINKDQISNIDELWEAHKLRNKVVHDVEYRVVYEEAKKAVVQYEKTLKEVGAL